MIPYELHSIEVSRLRGFRDAKFVFPERIAFLVGPNNSGKTSILRMLEWALNEARRETLMGGALLSAEEAALLVPANNSGGRGRRITLRIAVGHRGSQRRYGCDGEGVAALRIGVRADGGVRANLGEPRRGESDADQLAFELLERLRDRTVFTLIRASRDAESSAFSDALREAAHARMAERALHTRHGGTHSEYRTTSKALEGISDIANDLLAPLWDDINKFIPLGIARGATLGPEVDSEALVRWLADRTALKLVTGAHDEAGVTPDQVGAGLQSVLELAINRAGGAEGVDWIIGLEEPEAFLHPAALRSLARSLPTDNARLIVSTHSGTVVDEAAYGQVVLVRDHRFYHPRAQDSASRASINTALMTGAGSEMLFARSVLLVEGPGDRLFMEGLRRRLADSGVALADSLWAVSVGGKDFSAWMKLLQAFGDEGDRPIHWTLLADDDAASELLNAYRGVGLALPSAARPSLQTVADDYGNGQRAAIGEVDVRQVNSAASSERRGPFLMYRELEGAMLSSATDATAARIVDRIGAGCSRDLAGLENHLRGDKAKRKRAVAAQELPWCEVGGVVRMALERWMAPPLEVQEARQILSDLGAYASAS